jgi:hypothetical protein
MYALMEPITVTIDDRLPFRKDSNSTLYASISPDKAVWGPLLEKAFSKYHGTYEATNGGWPDVAFNTLAGAPGIEIRHAGYKRGKMWKAMMKAEVGKDYITLGCWTDWKGLISGHAYSVIKVVRLSNKVKLV